MGGGQNREQREPAAGMVPLLDSRKCLGRWKGGIPRLGQTVFKESWQENKAGPCRINVANSKIWLGQSLWGCSSVWWEVLR